MQPPLQVVVYYDFASTLCYVAHRVMEGLAGDLELLEIDLVWRPIDLTRITGWARGTAFPAALRARVEQTAAALGVHVRMPPRWIDSRPVSAVALGLRRRADEAAWRARVWRAIFEERCDLSDPADLPRLAAEAGIDPGDWQEPAALGRVTSETERARAMHVTGVPTFMLGRWPFGGIQEPETMRAMFARWARRQRRDPGH